MEIFNKEQLKNCMKEYYPDGGIVFAEYQPDILASNILVTDGMFGARQVVPYRGEVFDFDWNIDEYRENDLFVVFNHNDILQMIQTLTSGLKIPLYSDL